MATQVTKIPKGWKETALEEAAEKIGMGPFGSNIKVETFVDEGIPVISGTHLRGTKLEDKEYNFVTEKHAEELKSANAFPGDVVFTHAGNIGQVAFIPKNAKYKKYILSQRQFYLRPKKEKLLPEFITYYFKTRAGQYKLLANANQTGVPSISRPVSYLRSITVALPSVSEQRAIVEALESLDNKVELLRKQNKTLEATAQSIFKEWFINPSLYKKLPKGWKLGKLADEFEIVMGQSPEGESYNESGEGVIFFQGRTDFGFRFPNIRLYTRSPKRIAEKFDALVSVRAPVGDINMALDTCCIGRGVAAVKSKFKSYAYYKIKTLKRSFENFEKSGTIFGSMNKDDFNDIEVSIPDKNWVIKFEKLAKPIDAKIYNNYQQLQSLSELRDTILPKLMLGEVRIKGVSQ